MRVALMLMVLGAACRPAPREEKVEATPERAPAPTPPPTTGGATAATPILSAVVPDSVRLTPNTVTEIVLRGRGFATTATNTVHVGPIVIAQVPGNASGAEIRVVVPARYTTNAEAPPRPLFPGSYPVSVDVGGRQSNAVMLKVMP